jgi:hypothetical protein
MVRRGIGAGETPRMTTSNIKSRFLKLSSRNHSLDHVTRELRMIQVLLHMTVGVLSSLMRGLLREQRGSMEGLGGKLACNISYDTPILGAPIYCQALC